MGFIINDDKKQYINLSIDAWISIKNDIKDFSFGKRNINLSGFLNTIFSNYYELSLASITYRVKEEEDRLKDLFKKIDYKDFIDIYLEDYKRKLEKKMNSFPKGKDGRFRINNDNYMLLTEEISENIYYKGSSGLYLKAIYEDYSSKAYFEREKIYFKETIDKIEEAILKKKQIKIKLLSKEYKNKDYSRSFYVTPYKIIQDKGNNFNYIVGYSNEIKNGECDNNSSICSFRLSRIDTIKIMESKTGFLSKEAKEKIEDKIKHNNVQFLAGDSLNVEVKFDEKGLELFHNQLYMRPNEYEIIDKYTYIFHCTEVQAINYFFKMGNHIEIISPLYLRNKFKIRYKNALNKYE